MKINWVNRRNYSYVFFGSVFLSFDSRICSLLRHATATREKPSNKTEFHPTSSALISPNHFTCAKFLSPVASRISRNFVERLMRLIYLRVSLFVCNLQSLRTTMRHWNDWLINFAATKFDIHEAEGEKQKYVRVNWICLIMAWNYQLGDVRCNDSWNRKYLRRRWGIGIVAVVI